MNDNNAFVWIIVAFVIGITVIITGYTIANIIGGCT